jgi:hypothetical protein
MIIVTKDHTKTDVMKKLLFLMIVLLVSGAIQAQGSIVKNETKSFLAFHAGPSFPVGDFGSTNLINSNNTLSNRDAGFAKTGVNVNVTYGYKVLGNLGLTASAFYNSNKLDNAAIEKEMGLSEIGISGLKLDHWKWYGLTVGPMLTHNLTPNLTADLRVMGGMANANTPKIVFESVQLVKEDWALAPVFQAGLDLRIGVSSNMFLFTNVDYFYMKPKFKMESNIDNELVTETVKQKMTVINLTGGFEIRF